MLCRYGHVHAYKRKDGSTAYTAQVLVKKAAVILFGEAKTFEKRKEAHAWMEGDRSGLAEIPTLAERVGW